MNNVRVLTGFAIEKMFKYFAVFIVAAVVCNSSEYLPWCFSNVRDALICRAGVFINNICVKYFRAFAVVAEVVRNFFAGVGWFNINVVFLNNGSYSFLESYWTTAYVNCCEIGVVFGFCFLFIFCVNTFIWLNVELSILWASRNLLILDSIRFFRYWLLINKILIFVSSSSKAVKFEHIISALFR